jgi:predicted GNAT family N-acyltransferase
MATGLKQAVQIRAMTAADLAAAHALSREQQWPHREEDWAGFLALGQGLIAESDGEILGTTMNWLYGTDYATVGMVIVANAAQGMGIGRRLMEATIEQLGERTILLNATDEGLRLYKSLGFVATGSVYQHQGAAFSVPMAELIPNERIAPMKTGEVPDIAQIDSRATGLNRSKVVEYLCDAAQGVVLNRDGDQAGFALFRRFGRGYSIGPTVAPDIGGAKALITHWLGSNAGMFCRLDVPEDSDLSGWLDELGLPCVGRVTHMCRGTPPAAGKDVHAYSLINQALG